MNGMDMQGFNVGVGLVNVQTTYTNWANHIEDKDGWMNDWICGVKYVSHLWTWQTTYTNWANHIEDKDGWMNDRTCRGLM